MRNFKVVVPFVAFFLALVAQLVLITNSFSVVTDIRRRDVESDFTYESYRTENRAFESFNMLKTVIDAMTGDNAVPFTETSTATVSLEQATSLAAEVDSYIDRLNLPTEVISKIIIIGSSFDKLAYVKEIGGTGKITENLPCINQLSFIGLTDWEEGSTLWSYYPEGELLSRFESILEKDTLSLGSDLRVNTLRFVDMLDGKLVISFPSAHGGSRIFITVKRDFLSSCASEQSILTLVCGGKVVWSGSETGKLLFRKDAEPDSTWQSAIGRTSYNNKYISLGAGGPEILSLLISAPINSDIKGIEFTRSFLYISLIFTLLSAFLAYLFVLLMFRLVRRLTSNFGKQFNNGQYNEINKESGLRKSFSLPIRLRLLTIFIVSVVVPVIFCGMHYQMKIVDYSNSINNAYLDTVSDIIVESVDSQIDNAILYSALYPEDQIVSYLRVGITSPAIMKSRLDAVFSESDLFTHYAIFGSDGAEIFNSKAVYSAHTLDTEKAPSDACSLATIANNASSSESSAPAIVYPLFYEEEDGEDTLCGYFALYLKVTRLYELRPDTGHEFAVTDGEGNLIFASINTSANREKLGQITEIAEFGGSTDYKVTLCESRFGVHIYTYNDMGYLNEQTAHLRSSNYLVLLIVLGLVVIAAALISQRISAPLRALAEDMRSITDVSSISPIAYGQYDDEISALVESYNEMLSRMSSLVEENARRINRENELLRINARTELKMLQQQINPHFLYNTLEFINYNAKREGSSVAADMAVALANFFRYTTSMKDDIVMLSDELHHVSNYIEIHRLRYGERFTAEFNIQEGTESLRVMKFILQPIVENSFKHGIANKTRGAVVRVESERIGDDLILRISDNGIGMRASMLAELREKLKPDIPADDDDQILPHEAPGSGGGVGLINVYRRLGMYYGNRMKLEIESVFMHGMTVTVTIPAIG